MRVRWILPCRSGIRRPHTGHVLRANVFGSRAGLPTADLTVRAMPHATAKHYDRDLFLALAGVLVGFGVLMVHSASITSWPTEFEQVYLSRHLIYLLIGATAAAICACRSEKFWYSAAPFLFLITGALLVLVLIPGVGTQVKGAQRWLRFGSFSMQPSELAKVALPLFVCRILCQRRGQLNNWLASFVPVLLPIGLVVPLVFVQPDLGTALFLALGCGIALFVGGWPMRYFVAATAIAAPLVGGLVAMRPYQVRRITGFLDTWTDLNQAPYQLKQSLVSLGAGGLSGVGVGRGWQKLSFLPEANTDFVFAVVGEELGLIGTLGMIAVWIGLYVTGLRMLARLPRQSFAFLAGVTLLTQLALQAMLNVAVVTAMVPPKGISFPLLSYGGSNLVVSLVALGIVIGLCRQQEHAGRVE